MPTNRMMTLQISLNRLNNVMLALMPRVRLYIIHRLGTNTITRSQHYARLVSLRKRRLSRHPRTTNHLSTNYGAACRRQVFSINNRDCLQAVSVTRVNDTTTGVTRSKHVQFTCGTTRLPRAGTRRTVHINYSLLPRDKRSITISRAPRRFTNNKRRGVLRIIRSLVLHVHTITLTNKGSLNRHLRF